MCSELLIQLVSHRESLLNAGSPSPTETIVGSLAFSNFFL